jgi:hypothetical protein
MQFKIQQRTVLVADDEELLKFTGDISAPWPRNEATGAE